MGLLVWPHDNARYTAHSLSAGGSESGYSLLRTDFSPPVLCTSFRSMLNFEQISPQKEVSEATFDLQEEHTASLGYHETF